MLTQVAKLDDLVAWEDNPEYSRTEAVLKNATGADIALTTTRGQPVKSVGGVYCVTVDADNANIVGIIISDNALTLTNGSTSTSKHVLLIREAIIRKDGIAALDVAGATRTKATVKTALESLSPPILVATQATQYTQQQT